MSLNKQILETERLILSEFKLSDAAFVQTLLNSPTWLEFIGDKGINTKEAALNYIKNSLLKSYQENGFGLWLIALKTNHEPIGMCGLVNRESLPDVDIGFALLPKYAGLGYAFEAANATMQYGKNQLQLKRIIAITDTHNTSSIKLLNKIGLQFERNLKLSESDSVLVFAPRGDNE